MPNTSRGTYSVIFSNIIPGNIIISKPVDITISSNPIEQLLTFINSYLVEIDCVNSISLMNSAVIEYINILPSIISYVQTLLNNGWICDFGYKAQLSRLLDLINYLLITAPKLIVNDECKICILNNIFIWLYDNTLTLANSIAIVDGISSLNSKCSCRNRRLFDLYMGRIVNTVTKLQNSVQQLKYLLCWIINVSYNSKRYLPTYVVTNNFNAIRSK